MKTYITIFMLAILSSCSVEEIPDQGLIIECTVSADISNNWDRANEIVTEINSYRESINLSAFRTNKGIAVDLGLEHNVYMMDRQRISHDNFQQRARILSQQGAQSVGENVAFGYNNGAEVVNAWINSQEHRDVLEGNYTDASVAVTKDIYGVLYITLLVTRL
jgi:uncharacterized protein YkwD